MTIKAPLATTLFLAMSSSAVLSAQTPLAVNARRLQLDADTMWITRIANGHEIPGGSAISILHRGSGDDLVLRYTYQPTGKSPVTIITQLNAESLRPTREVHDYGTGDTLVVHFGPQGAHAELRRGGSAQWYAPDTAARGAFSSAALDQVLRSLPLRDRYEAVLPVYFAYLNQTVSVHVRVRRTQRLRTRRNALVECWDVEGVFPGGAVEQFWIAKDSRVLIRVLGHLAPDTLERYER